MELGLKGRTVAVTGGATGIGRAIAEAFAREGCAVCIGARREDKLEEVRAAFEGMGWAVDTQRVDVTQEEDMASFAERTCARFGRLDVWVNNAGLTCHAPDTLAGGIRAVHPPAFQATRVLATLQKGAQAGSVRLLVPVLWEIPLCRHQTAQERIVWQL